MFVYRLNFVSISSIVLRPADATNIRNEQQFFRIASDTATKIASCLSDKPKTMFDMYMNMLETFKQHVMGDRDISLHQMATNSLANERNSTIDPVVRSSSGAGDADDANGTNSTTGPDMNLDRNAPPVPTVGSPEEENSNAPTDNPLIALAQANDREAANGGTYSQQSSSEALASIALPEKITMLNRRGRKRKIAKRRTNQKRRQTLNDRKTRSKEQENDDTTKRTLRPRGKKNE